MKTMMKKTEKRKEIKRRRFISLLLAAILFGQRFFSEGRYDNRIYGCTKGQLGYFGCVFCEGVRPHERAGRRYVRLW